MRSVGGYILKTSAEKDIKKQGHYSKLIFRFSTPPEGNDCLLDITFYLTPQNKCFKYDERFWGNTHLDAEVNALCNSSYGFKKEKKSLKWINTHKSYEARVYTEKSIHNKTASVYMLEFKKSDSLDNNIQHNHRPR